jgi:aminoglycoside phosphotransferase (APT) family kinase protein
MHLYVEDTRVVGTPFFIMSHVEGRVYRDPGLPDMAKSERAALILDMIQVLTRLHGVDYAAAGLSDFGRPGNYYARQISRWTKQYRASETQVMDPMNRLIEWLPHHVPEDDRTTLVHGDYRIENAIVAPDAPKVLAIVDWELSTLGHPYADLAHFCILHHLPPHAFGGYLGTDIASRGIPAEREIVAAYCHAGRIEFIENWSFYIAFALFRMAAILQGVYARALAGSASSRDGLERGAKAAVCAERGWALVERT